MDVSSTQNWTTGSKNMFISETGFQSDRIFKFLFCLSVFHRCFCESCSETADNSNGGVVQFCHQCLLSRFCVHLCTILFLCLLIVQEVYV